MKIKEEVEEKQWNVLIADDHQMFLQGLSTIILEHPKVSHCVLAKNGEEAFAKIQEHQIDLLLLDLAMPEIDGLSLIKKLQSHKISIPTLIISTSCNAVIVSRLKRLGIQGYLLKNADTEELYLAMEQLMHGKTYFMKEVMEILEQKPVKSIPLQASVSELSRREKEILKLIALEYTAQEIADHLFISKHTVNTHRKNLLSKLLVKNTAGMVKYAVENGLVD